MQIDPHGNYEQIGSKFVSGRTLDELVPLICAEIRHELPDVKLTCHTHKYSGGRSIKIIVLDPGNNDITDRVQAESLEKKISEIAARFNSQRGNIYSDYDSSSFHCFVQIDSSAYALHAGKSGPITNPVEKKISLTEFKRLLKPGDKMNCLHGSRPGMRVVKKIRSADFVFEGPLYMSWGRAADFACDGNKVRFALGNEREPDRHILYEWIRS